MHRTSIVQLSEEELWIFKSPLTWYVTHVLWLKTSKNSSSQSAPKANHTLTVIADAPHRHKNNHTYIDKHTHTHTHTHTHCTMTGIVACNYTLLLLSWLTEIRSLRCLDAICLWKLFLISIIHNMIMVCLSEITGYHSDFADRSIAVQDEAPHAWYRVTATDLFNPNCNHEAKRWAFLSWQSWIGP